jgi:two-component system copper resistance phosphate regulon response regulator CusR
MKVLVIEDEPQVSNFIREGLRANSIEAEVAYDGTMAKRMALSRQYDAVLVDIVIPDINGFELCKILKKEKPLLPIMMLTTLGTTADKVTGFNAGADDYLLKPFELDELVVRLRALTRRTFSHGIEHLSKLSFSDLILDLDTKTVNRNGKSIKLSAKELSLLEYFMKNPGRVISRTELAEKVWNLTFETGTNVVEVYINMLRNKIDRGFPTKLIQTRIGLGYILSSE